MTPKLLPLFNFAAPAFVKQFLIILGPCAGRSGPTALLGEGSIVSWRGVFSLDVRFREVESLVECVFGVVENVKNRAIMTQNAQNFALAPSAFAQNLHNTHKLHICKKDSS